MVIADGSASESEENQHEADRMEISMKVSNRRYNILKSSITIICIYGVREFQRVHGAI